MASRITEALERIKADLNEKQRRTVQDVARFITREFNSAVNASATQNSFLGEAGEVSWGGTVLVEVQDPTAPNGVRTFRVTVEEWDI